MRPWQAAVLRGFLSPFGGRPRRTPPPSPEEAMGRALDRLVLAVERVRANEPRA